MSLSVTPECLICHFQRTLKKAQTLGDDRMAMRFAKELMQIYISAPEDVSSPWYNPSVEALFQKFYGVEPDQYREEKEQANRFVMDRLEQIQSMVEQSADPVFAALRLAILGNYLDFAALQGQISFEKLEEMLRDALNMELDEGAYESLCADLAKGKHLLYLTDNAGEIGFDRVLAEQIHKRYPHLEIVFCVRGGIIINDATREDAEIVGIPFKVIDNGNLISGTELTQLGQEAREAMDTADVIISKGMANTETLYGCGYNIYYAFLVKCVRFAQEFGKPLFTPMLIREKR